MSRSFTAASSQYIEIDSAVASGPPFTMGCWFNVNDITGDHTLFAINDKDASASFFMLDARGGTTGDPVRFAARHESGSYNAADTSTGYSANTWHMAVGVAASTTGRLAYIDGGSEATNTTSCNPSNLDRTSIGRTGDATPGGYTDGLIAHAFVYNYALSATEVAELYAAKHPLLYKPGSLTAYWPLMANDRDMIGDFHMTAYNTPTFGAEPTILRPRSPIITGYTASTTATPSALPFGFAVPAPYSTHIVKTTAGGSSDPLRAVGMRRTI